MLSFNDDTATTANVPTTLVDEIGGDPGWARYPAATGSYAVTAAGPVTFTWTYAQGNGAAQLDNAGYLDQVVWVPDTSASAG